MYLYAEQTDEYNNNIFANKINSNSITRIYIRPHRNSRYSNIQMCTAHKCKKTLVVSEEANSIGAADTNFWCCVMKQTDQGFGHLLTRNPLLQVGRNVV